MRTNSGVSYARGFQQVIQATKDAPIIHETTTTFLNGKKGKSFQSWISGSNVARILPGPEGSISEFRMGPSTIYWRYSKPDYETLSKRGPDHAPFNYYQFGDYSLEKILKSTEGKNPESKLLETKTVEWEGRTVTRYTLSMASFVWKSNRYDKSEAPDLRRFVYADPKTARIVGLELPNPFKRERVFRSIIEYPESVDSSVFEPPAPSGIPRFEIEAERVKAKAYAKSVKPIVLKGETVKLLDVSQSPGGTLGVVWQGTPMGADAKHLIKLNGVPIKSMGYKIRTKTPQVTGTWFARKGQVTSVDIELPVHKGTRFLGYVKFKAAKVRQSVPFFSVSDVFK
jgi:hypothetical protein